ncbi:BTAD domain-containing putative transcriptional regulator [Nonomuraea fastidiosa]|uniref:AfsR/SARP family transcriptional regulator n=1 Tax=Nonomuraea TaxID=83681 RepID=UPI00324E7B32
MTVEAAGPDSLLRLFGSVEVWEGERPRSLGRPQAKRLIAALAYAKGNAVDLAELIDWIWDDGGDDDHTEQVQKLISDVRRSLREAGMPVQLPCEGKAYRLDLDDDRVDAWLLSKTVAQAEELAADGCERQAGILLDPVLDFCRGTPLTGLPGTRIETYRRALTQEVRRARLLLSAIDIRAGRHVRQIGPLTTLHEEDRGNAAVAELLMHALYRDGRLELVQEVQQRVQAYLNDVSGTTSPRLRELGLRMFEGDADLMRPEAVELPGVPRRAKTTVIRAERVDESVGQAGAKETVAEEEAVGSRKQEAQDRPDSNEEHAGKERGATRAGTMRDKVTNFGQHIQSIHAETITMNFGERP